MPEDEIPTLPTSKHQPFEFTERRHLALKLKATIVGGKSRAARAR